MKHLRVDLTRKIYNSRILYRKRGTDRIYAPLSLSMQRRYKYRGPPLALNGSR